MIHLQLCIWKTLISKMTYTAFKLMHSLAIKPMTLVSRTPWSIVWATVILIWIRSLIQIQIHWRDATQKNYLFMNRTLVRGEPDRTVSHTKLLYDEEVLEYTVARKSCGPILWHFYGAFTSFLKLENVSIIIAWKTATKTFFKISHVMVNGRKKGLETTWGINKWCQNFYFQMICSFSLSQSIQIRLYACTCKCKCVFFGRVHVDVDRLPALE